MTTKTRRNYDEEVPVGAAVIPLEQDVLCGTGRKPARHPGNIVFRQLVTKYFHYYHYGLLDEKKTKSDASTAIFEEITIKLQGRFLKKDPIYNIWYVAPERTGRDKISHCLRDLKHRTKLSKPQLKGVALRPKSSQLTHQVYEILQGNDQPASSMDAPTLCFPAESSTLIRYQKQDDAAGEDHYKNNVPGLCGASDVEKEFDMLLKLLANSQDVCMAPLQQSNGFSRSQLPQRCNCEEGTGHLGPFNGVPSSLTHSSSLNDPINGLLVHTSKEALDRSWSLDLEEEVGERAGVNICFDNTNMPPLENSSKGLLRNHSIVSLSLGTLL